MLSLDCRCADIKYNIKIEIIRCINVFIILSVIYFGIKKFLTEQEEIRSWLRILITSGLKTFIKDLLNLRASVIVNSYPTER